MRVVSASELQASVARDFGFQHAQTWDSPEIIAALLRRAAGFLCPCPGVSLLRSVAQTLRTLANGEQFEDRVEDTLEGMAAYGDLIEQRDATVGSLSTLLFAAPPASLRRPSGLTFLMGVSPDHESPLPADLAARIEHVGYTRRLPPGIPDLDDYLRDAGFIELTESNWLRRPPSEDAASYRSRFDRALQSSRPATDDVPGLTVLDASQSPRYYRGRWCEPKAKSGLFLGRRRQAYGADLWCYVSLRQGRPERFVDLPLIDPRARGCDEGWLLQMAIDAIRGQPQVIRTRVFDSAHTLMEFFSPAPKWARRRWDAVGYAGPTAGCLFSYVVPTSEIVAERKFAEEWLWMKDIP